MISICNLFEGFKDKIEKFEKKHNVDLSIKPRHMLTAGKWGGVAGLSYWLGSKTPEQKVAAKQASKKAVDDVMRKFRGEE